MKIQKHFIPVKDAIDKLIQETKKEPILIAIDGKCASGKTTLGEYLKEIYDCNLFHMDDFFLQNNQRTKERLEETGGNIDYERFFEEVLNPLMRKNDVLYRPFDCSDRTIHDGRNIAFKKLNIMEGSYSMHPYFGNPYDLKIFMNISEEEQLNNIERRNGKDMLLRFKEEWIPKENDYFAQFHIMEGCLQIEYNSYI